MRTKIQNLIDYNQELNMLKQVTNTNRTFNSNSAVSTNYRKNMSRQGLSKTQKLVSFQTGSTRHKSTAGMPSSSDYNQNDLSFSLEHLQGNTAAKYLSILSKNQLQFQRPMFRSKTRTQQRSQEMKLGALGNQSMLTRQRKKENIHTSSSRSRSKDSGYMVQRG